MGVPDGFVLVLPQEWVSLELDPALADESLRRLVDALVREDQIIADERDRVEELLSSFAHEAADEGALLCAVRFDVDEQGRPVQASVAVTLRGVQDSSGPDTIISELRGGDIVEITAGPAVRFAEQTQDGFLSLLVLVPVPGIEGRVAAISLLSPSVSHEAQLTEFFDAVVNSFTFTWHDEEAV